MHRSNRILLITITTTLLQMSAAWAASDPACVPEAGTSAKACSSEVRAAYPLAEWLEGASDSGFSLAIAGLGLAVMAIRTRRQ